MSINETQRPTEEELEAMVEDILAGLLAPGLPDYECGIALGIRAGILCLWQAGHLTAPALAYAGVLGQEEIDPLIVANLGIYRGGQERFGAEVTAAFEAHKDEAERAVSDLIAAADDMGRGEEAEGDGAGEASDAAQD